MKKLMLFSFAVLAIAGSFSSCKKGENDPFLSLRSRKARLAGKWTVTYARETSSHTDSYHSSQLTSTYDGTTWTDVSTTTMAGGQPTTNTTVEHFTINYDIKKDGTFTAVMQDTDDGSATHVEGTWTFVGKSKENDLKNKEAFILDINNDQYTGGGDGGTVYTGMDGEIYTIDELRNKTMVWKQNSSSNSNGSSSSRSLEMKLEQK